MYTLYYSPGTASLAVHLALLEIGAPYRLERVDFDKQQQRSEAYLRLNPQGTVPTLLIEGRPYAESVALLMMLADRHPEARLAPPPGDAARNEWYQWLVYLGNSLGASYRFWFYPQEFGSAEHLPPVRAGLKAKIEAAWDRIDAELSARGGPYLLGAQLSAADLLLLMYMRWSRNMPRTALAWPALKELATRLRARPSWQKACDLEQLTEWRS
jgi:glutathione S-transferase